MISNTIYLCRSPSGKVYVGKTKDYPRRRLVRHSRGAYTENSKVYNTKFSRAIRKYGIQNFEIEALYTDVPDDLVDVAEICAIYLHDSYESGYNMTTGGEGLQNPSIETRKKMSLAKAGKIPWNKGKKGLQISHNKGKKLSIKQRKIISERTKEAMSRSDVREKYLNGMKKRNTRSGDSHPKPWLGKHHSEETKRKISETLKKRSGGLS
jgi:group I intron endonuclease